MWPLVLRSGDGDGGHRRWHLGGGLVRGCADLALESVWAGKPDSLNADSNFRVIVHSGYSINVTAVNCDKSLDAKRSHVAPRMPDGDDVFPHYHLPLSGGSIVAGNVSLAILVWL